MQIYLINSVMVSHTLPIDEVKKRGMPHAHSAGVIWYPSQ